MATHSSILALRIPWTKEPGGPWSIGLQRVGHDWCDWAQSFSFSTLKMPLHCLLSATVPLLPHLPMWPNLSVLLSFCWRTCLISYLPFPPLLPLPSLSSLPSSFFYKAFSLSPSAVLQWCTSSCFALYLSLQGGGSDGKESACTAADLGSIGGSGRSPGEGHGNPLQYSCWRIPWTKKPGGLQSMGLQRVGHDWVTNTNLSGAWRADWIRGKVFFFEWLLKDSWPLFLAYFFFFSLEVPLYSC